MPNVGPIGYRDQRDADIQRGICPDCGTYVQNLLPGDGGRCPVCWPREEFRDDQPYDPEGRDSYLDHLSEYERENGPSQLDDQEGGCAIAGQ